MMMMMISSSSSSSSIVIAINVIFEASAGGASLGEASFAGATASASRAMNNMTLYNV